MTNPNFTASISTNELYRDLDTTVCLTDLLDGYDASLDELQDVVSNLDNTYAVINHAHSGYALMTDVTALQDAISSKANSDHTHDGYAESIHIHDDRYYTESEVDSKVAALNSAIDLKADIVDYNESIIGLSVNGTIVTYVKGDGSVHTFETQDTDTTYSLGTDEVTGLTKLYATIGSAEDGTMTQRAIKTELDKKVGVTIDDSQNALVFTI